MASTSSQRSAGDTFGPPEQAMKVCFDFNSKTWIPSAITVRLALSPFSKGCQRIAFKLREMDESGTAVTRECVAKFMDQNSLVQNGVGPVTRQMYFDDVITQLVAGRYAEGFNNFDPPKHIKFLPAWIMEFTNRPGSPLAVVEPYMQGKFLKHNNNMGGIFSMRNTPQAFSHFTWEASQHRKIVCDMQGVDDFYTDPQIHTVDQRKYGLGNMGMRGIQTFLTTHTCNAVCQLIGLPRLVNGQVVAPALRDVSKPPRPASVASSSSSGGAVPAPAAIAPGVVPQPISSSSSSSSATSSASTAPMVSGKPPVAPMGGNNNNSKQQQPQQQVSNNSKQQQQQMINDPSGALMVQEMWLSRAETPPHTASAMKEYGGYPQNNGSSHHSGSHYHQVQQQQHHQHQQQQHYSHQQYHQHSQKYSQQYDYNNQSSQPYYYSDGDENPYSQPYDWQQQQQQQQPQQQQQQQQQQYYYQPPPPPPSDFQSGNGYHVVSNNNGQQQQQQQQQQQKPAVYKWQANGKKIPHNPADVTIVDIPDEDAPSSSNNNHYNASASAAASAAAPSSSGVGPWIPDQNDNPSLVNSQQSQNYGAKSSGAAPAAPSAASNSAAAAASTSSRISATIQQLQQGQKKGPNSPVATNSNNNNTASNNNVFNKINGANNNNNNNNNNNGASTPHVAVASGAVGERIQCSHPGCGKSFFTAQRLQAHIQEAHSGAPPSSGAVPPPPPPMSSSSSNQLVPQGGGEVSTSFVGSMKAGIEAMACAAFR